MSDSVSSRWMFGGPLADVPPDTAWIVLAFAAALGAMIAWVSYRHSVRRLGYGAGAVLTLLRSATLMLLIFCLAAPVRIEHRSEKPATPPPPTPSAARLAVLIDRSDSMTLADNRGHTRLDDAVTTWRRIAPIAESHFSAIQYFSFADDLRPAKTMDEAMARAGGTGETRLYRAVDMLLKKETSQRPHAVVVLTDGVDTSNDPDALLRDAALAAGVPVYFVAGNNRSLPPEPFVRVREMRAPPTAMRNNGFTLEASFEAFSRADRTVPFSLWQGDKQILREELQLTMGPNLVTRSFSVLSGEPGAEDFTLRIGAKEDAPIAARVTTQILSPRASKLRILIYQSALDWGLRYFSSALRSDAAFEYFTILAPEVGLAVAPSEKPGGTMRGRLPEEASPFTQFDCLVLVQPFPQRWSPAQQQAVIDYVRGGGSVFFLSPDAEAMQQFATAPLRQLLPVYLSNEAAAAADDGKPSLEDPKNRTVKPKDGERIWTESRLASFVLTEAGRASPIFARAGSNDGPPLLPRFLDYVTVNRPKPGATVLALHPTGTDPSGQRFILLATQNFGMGRSALLTTDSLWRWKLDEPSSSRAVETFWRQLLLALASPSETGVLRFADAPAQGRLGQSATLRLRGVKTEGTPVVYAKGPGGRSITLPVKSTGDTETPWAVEWTPDQPGAWELTAEVDRAPRATLYLPVTAEPTGEHARSVTNLDALRALAGETGGELLSREAPAAWRAQDTSTEPNLEATSEQTVPLWNTWKVLSAILACYALELILRRFWKLL